MQAGLDIIQSFRKRSGCMPPRPDEPNQNITMSYMNNKGLWGFVGGMIAAAIGAKVVKSPLPGNWPSRAFPRPCSSSRRPWNNWQTSGKKPKTCAMRPPRKTAGRNSSNLIVHHQTAGCPFPSPPAEWTAPNGETHGEGRFPFFSLSMHYQVIHHTPGRLRVRSGRCAFNHDQAYGIECRLLKQKGVYSVKATPATEVCSSCMKEPAPRPFSARWTGSGRKHSAATNRKSARRPGNWPGPFFSA